MPFVKIDDAGIQAFFHKNHNIDPDEHVFDGSTVNYFSKVKRLIDISSLADKSIIDLGCGKGSFYFWLLSNNIFPISYLGVDFAVDTKILGENAVIVKENINNQGVYQVEGNNLFFTCNVLCYLRNKELESVLNMPKVGDSVIIIEPSPGVFWDAHFNGIRPKYRKLKTMIQLLIDANYSIETVYQDYLFKICNNYYQPLSYAIHATRKSNH